MDEVFSVAEIKERYQSEWVLLKDPLTSEALEVLGGTVIWHSKDRDEVYRKAREVRPRHAAILYTGELPEDAAIVLPVVVPYAATECHGGWPAETRFLSRHTLAD